MIRRHRSYVRISSLSPRPALALNPPPSHPPRRAPMEPLRRPKDRARTKQALGVGFPGGPGGPDAGANCPLVPRVSASLLPRLRSAHLSAALGANPNEGRWICGRVRLEPAALRPRVGALLRGSQGRDTQCTGGVSANFRRSQTGGKSSSFILCDV